MVGLTKKNLKDITSWHIILFESQVIGKCQDYAYVKMEAHTVQDYAYVKMEVHIVRYIISGTKYIIDIERQSRGLSYRRGSSCQNNNLDYLQRL